MVRYIYKLPKWPDFYWEQEKLSAKLAHIHQRQGQILGTMQALGFSVQNEALLQNLALDVLKSSEIEGEVLNLAQVRSSIARRLGIPVPNYVKSSRNVDGMVEMILDATQNFNQALTEERLFNWNIALLSGDVKSIYLKMGIWRDDAEGPMQVVSGAIGLDRVHFEAPAAAYLADEMKRFLTWVNQNDNSDLVLKSAIAHLWFVTLHPFDDGNGRIARAITNWLLARNEQSAQRFYSISAQIMRERKIYYQILESTQKGNLDITLYLNWFLDCLMRALDETERTIKTILFKSKFWEQHASTPFNDRERLMLNKLLDGFKGKLTTTKWSKLTHSSQDTALRDINHLIALGILTKDLAGGRSTTYSLML